MGAATVGGAGHRGVHSSFWGPGDRTFHGHSYTANPLCAVAALANLELMDERATVDHAAWIGRTLGDLLCR